MVTLVVLAACGSTSASSSHPTTDPKGATATRRSTTTTGTDTTVRPTTKAGPDTADLSLAVEPEDDYDSLDGLIASARSSIDVTMYELADPRSEALLVAAHQRGVAVRVLLDREYAGATVNQAAYSLLDRAGVSVRWAPDDVILHQKTVTVDGAVSAIMTGNLTARYYPTTRDFVFVDRQAAAVAAIETEFSEDWDGVPVSAGPAVAGLVWSPGSELALDDLIGSARRSIVLENEEMDSAATESALEVAARRGVAVEVVMTADPEWDDAFEELNDAGVRVSTYPDSENALYIHAKAIVVDGDTAFVGSQNLSTSSLLYNRELGVITDDPGVVGPLAQTLSTDFAGATPFDKSAG